MKRHQTSVYLALTLLLATACQAPPTPEASALPSIEKVQLRGIVRTTRGEALAGSQVHLVRLGEISRESLGSLDVATDGTFEIAVPKDIAYQLDVTAPDHELLSLPLLVADPMHDVLEITLKPNIFFEAFEQVQVIGNWDDYETPISMQRRDDGTFVHVVEGAGEEVAYELLGVVTNRHSVNGTQSDRFEYDGFGDYRSVVRALNGRVEIVFDPTLLPHPVDAPAAVGPAEHALARGYAVAKAFDEATLEYQALRKADQKVDLKELYGEFLKELQTIVDDTDAAADLRQFAAVHVLRFPDLCGERELASAFALLPPESPFWIGQRGALYRLDADTHGELLTALSERNPDRRVRGIALAPLIDQAQKAGDDQRWHSLYAELADKYGDLRDVGPYLVRYNPESPIAPGKPAPDFQVTLLDGVELSSASLRGSYVLIDFWGTWCPPCLVEMPVLHEGWETHKDNGLKILSLSLDPSVEEVEKFRADNKWEMPWLQALVPAAMDSEQKFKEGPAKDFRLTGLPTYVLIDPQGQIVSLGRSSADAFKVFAEAMSTTIAGSS
jgi:thiol-disulfide isomerase/thioredoxin